MPHAPDIIISPITAADIPAAADVLIAAFGPNPTYRTRLPRYLGLQPDGWLAARLDGAVVGTVGAVDYGPYAYVGLMAVHPTLQGQGIGRRLLQHLLAWLDGRACPLSLLDATVYGAPLYERLGYIDDAEVVRLAPTAHTPAGVMPSAARPIEPSDIEAIARLDSAVYGADRRRVIRAYLADDPDRAFVVDDTDGPAGYLVAQTNTIGPWIARTPAVAATLLQAALTLPYIAPPGVIVPARCDHALDLLHRHGFQVGSRLRHMRRGGARNPRATATLYAQASYALG